MIIIHSDGTSDCYPGIILKGLVASCRCQSVNTRIGDTVDNTETEDELISLGLWIIVNKAGIGDLLAHEIVWIEIDELHDFHVINYMEVMELIYLYPNDFVGKKVTYTGFVYNDPQTKGYQFIFRFGIIHCIADSGVYGLATTGSDQTFKDNTWVTVTGTITVNYYQNLKQSLPILNLTEIKEVSQPDNPYVYRVF